MKLGPLRRPQNSPHPPTISFQEAVVKYGIKATSLKRLLAREDAPKFEIRCNNTHSPNQTYYNAAEFHKWISTIKE